ncbi:hypothetical protein [Leptolyngbya sp. BC1307]|jgi:hypothetical protein|uniref:hypothetical protein n=1 Tax=Leptolyngbya sp. BC1307 TaxID=2029589 RepID=UPI000EFAA858|nr:hypothetical protein [Leptolyngbya sp. BC1307]
MTPATFSTSVEAQQAAALLEGYCFELGHHDARQWVSLWLEFYRPHWIRDAVVEALYQGRYKSISVRQILELWYRRGQPIRHVTHDFEAAICREFGGVKLVPMDLDTLTPLQRHQPSLTKNKSSTAVSFDLSAASSDSSLSALPTPPDPAAKVESVSESLPDPNEQQFSSVLYGSTPGIQPFKPALPFSAQTLRLAKRKALV